MMGNRRRRWRKMVQFEYDYADCRRQALIFGMVRPFNCGKFQVFRVLPDGCSGRRDQSTARAPPWQPGSALEGKLSTDLDAQVFIAHLSKTRRRARCDRSLNRDRRTQRNGPSTVVPIGASSPGGFTSASAVNWSRRRRLRQIRGNPQYGRRLRRRESFGLSPSAPAGQGGLALPVSAQSIRLPSSGVRG